MSLPLALTLTLPANIQVIERGWLSANLIIAKGTVNAAIDSGYVSHAAQTVDLVRGALGGQPLNMLLNTHLHSDHCGGNAALQAAYPELKTLIPPGHSDQVANWDEVALSYQPTGQRCPRFTFNNLLDPGSTILLGDAPWEIHAAPGHDPHSVVLFERQSRCLISADALWENGFGVVFPELEGEEAFAAVGHTLNMIEALEPRLVVPGHGPMFQYSAEVLGRARERLQIFVANPLKHAKHAAKVLLKFKLLELQSQTLPQFYLWAGSTPYLRTVHERYFAAQDFEDWLELITHELVKSKVARIDDGVILNV